MRRALAMGGGPGPAAAPSSLAVFPSPPGSAAGLSASHEAGPAAQFHAPMAGAASPPSPSRPEVDAEADAEARPTQCSWGGSISRAGWCCGLDRGAMQGDGIEEACRRGAAGERLLPRPRRAEQQHLSIFREGNAYIVLFTLELTDCDTGKFKYSHRLLPSHPARDGRAAGRAAGWLLGTPLIIPCLH